MGTHPQEEATGAKAPLIDECCSSMLLFPVPAFLNAVSPPH